MNLESKKKWVKQLALSKAVSTLRELLRARNALMEIPRHVWPRADYTLEILEAIAVVRMLRQAERAKVMYALALPKDAGFKMLEDRLLFNENGSALIFESSTEASVNGMALAEQAVMVRVAVTPIGGAR